MTKMGIAYYPEHWDRSMWEDDAERMSRTGIKIVRLAEFAWSRLEPREGEYDFAWLDDAIDVFYRRGIEVVLETPSCTPSNWLTLRYPDALPVDVRKQPRFPGVRATVAIIDLPCGSSQSESSREWHPDMLDAAASRPARRSSRRNCR